MAEPTKLPVKNERTSTSTTALRPFENLRREIDRLVEDFAGAFGAHP